MTDDVCRASRFTFQSLCGLLRCCCIAFLCRESTEAAASAKLHGEPRYGLVTLGLASVLSLRARLLRFILFDNASCWCSELLAVCNVLPCPFLPRAFFTSFAREQGSACKNTVSLIAPGCVRVCLRSVLLVLAVPLMYVFVLRDCFYDLSISSSKTSVRSLITLVLKQASLYVGSVVDSMCQYLQDLFESIREHFVKRLEVFPVLFVIADLLLSYVASYCFVQMHNKSRFTYYCTT